MNGEIQSNCWSEMLSDDWAERRKVTNWKGLPQVHQYCNALINEAGPFHASFCGNMTPRS